MACCVCTNVDTRFVIGYIFSDISGVHMSQWTTTLPREWLPYLKRTHDFVDCFIYFQDFVYVIVVFETWWFYFGFLYFHLYTIVDYFVAADNWLLYCHMEGRDEVSQSLNTYFWIGYVFAFVALDGSSEATDILLIVNAK